MDCTKTTSHSVLHTVLLLRYGLQKLHRILYCIQKRHCIAYQSSTKTKYIVLHTNIKYKQKLYCTLNYRKIYLACIQKLHCIAYQDDAEFSASLPNSKYCIRLSGKEPRQNTILRKRKLPVLCFTMCDQ